jgi:DNA-directed RNA polymerase specialized sigma24 family protein
MIDSRDGSRSDDTASGALAFPVTSWTMIAGAKGEDSDAARVHLETLSRRYWRPVYLLMKLSVKCPERAKDLTQDFFAHFIQRDVVSYIDRERGRFRTFLSASARRFLALNHRDVVRRRRMEVSADELGGDGPGLLEAVDREDPVSSFMERFRRAYLQATVEAALTRFRSECVALGKEARFDVFVGRYRLCTSHAETYTEAAERHGITEKQVQKHLEAARRQFARIFREEVRQTLPHDVNVDDEIRDLLISAM